jgi:hypothetical protein
VAAASSIDSPAKCRDRRAWGLLPPGGVHQDAARSFRPGREKVAAVLPTGFVGGADQPEVRLVNRGGGLEGVLGGLVSHARGGEFAQVVVH